MARLDGKRALVTGGARGIGAATAKRFIEEGARVLITDVLEEDGPATAADLGDAARFQIHDVRQPDQWRTAVQACEDAFGGLDILVNNAGFGGGHFETLETIDPETIRKIVDINLIGVIYGHQAAIPAMRRAGRGSIINISSNTAIHGMNSLSVYGASKWAVRGLTKVAARELGPEIRVNSVHPGGADTPMSNFMGMEHSAFSSTMTGMPLQRGCEAREIADAVLYFASDESRHATGSELLIDGGQATGLYFQALPGHPQTPYRKLTSAGPDKFKDQ